MPAPHSCAPQLRDRPNVAGRVQENRSPLGSLCQSLPEPKTEEGRGSPLLPSSYPSIPQALHDPIGKRRKKNIARWDIPVEACWDAMKQTMPQRPISIPQTLAQALQSVETVRLCRIPTRLQRHVQSSRDSPLFTTDEVGELRTIFGS